MNGLVRLGIVTIAVTRIGLPGEIVFQDHREKSRIIVSFLVIVVHAVGFQQVVNR